MPMVSLSPRSLLAFAGLLLLLAAAPAHAAPKDGPLRWVHAGHIGAKGTGPGKFPEKTGGIAVDQDCGDVFIVDPEQKRINRFSMDGRLISSFGEPGSEGEVENPYGIEIRQPFTGRTNFDGPPPACGPITTVSPTLMVTDWGSSRSTARVWFYGLDGSLEGGWCERPYPGCTAVGSTTPFAGGPADPNGLDPFPTDVDAKGDHVWISGALDGEIREYTSSRTLIRSTEDANLNQPTGPSSLSVGDAPAYLWATDDSRSQVVLMDLDPSNRKILPITTLGGGEFDTGTPGSFGFPRGVEVGPAGPFFDDLFVVDGERIQVFTPGGDNGSAIARPELLGVIELPGSHYVGEFIDVRYDGTVYVSGVYSSGADVYTPGVVITFRVKALKDQRIRLSGRIFPPHARRRIRFDRLEQGWESIGRTRLEQGTRFKHVWRAPREGKTYTLRAFFKDQHDHHLNRASEILLVRARD